jgi:hypothetical protein
MEDHAPDDLLARLDRVESRQAIAALLTAYARGVDRFDEAAIRACFWPESTHRHGAFDGRSWDFLAFAARITSGMSHVAHHISNVSVEAEGDRGFSECYYFAHHRRPSADGAAEEDAFYEGRYLDLHERRGGVWKIIQRRGLGDWAGVLPPGGLLPAWPDEQRSARAPDDAYYDMLNRFRRGG